MFSSAVHFTNHLKNSNGSSTNWCSEPGGVRGCSKWPKGRVLTKCKLSRCFLFFFVPMQIFHKLIRIMLIFKEKQENLFSLQHLQSQLILSSTLLGTAQNCDKKTGCYRAERSHKKNLNLSHISKNSNRTTGFISRIKMCFCTCDCGQKWR